MGLDIAFNRTEAIAAGMAFGIKQNGTKEEIAAFEQEGGNEELLEYLRKESAWVQFPGTSRMTDNGDENIVVIEASRWGRNYAPLTSWLKSNGIQWEEF